MATAVECLADPGQGFYIPAAAQEALLVELLGLRGAGQIDRIGAEPGQGPPGPPPAALPPDPLPAEPPVPSSSDSEDVAVPQPEAPRTWPRAGPWQGRPGTGRCPRRQPPFGG